MRWIQRNPGWAVAVYGIVLALAFAAGVFYFKNAQLDRTNKTLESKTAEAETNATRAENESAAKGLALAEYDRLADSTLFAQAKAEADVLFPVSPELVAKIEVWQRTYAPLLGRLAGHEATLAKLRESSAPNAAAGAGDAARAADLGGDAKMRFKHDVLAKLVDDMRAFMDPKSGEFADVQARLLRSKEIKKKTIGDHTKAWKESIARIAANPKYGGLVLTEQVGLIPLGPDKDSTLEEFYETETGEAPRRDAQGKIIVTEEDGDGVRADPEWNFLDGIAGRGQGETELRSEDVRRRRPGA